MRTARSRSRSAWRSRGRPNTRTTRVRPTGGATSCPRSSCRAITAGSANGGSNRAASAWAAAAISTAQDESRAPSIPLAAARRARDAPEPRRPSFAMSGVIDSLERAQLRRVPNFQAGDRVKVHFQVVEGSRRRTQVFEGVVLKRQGSGARETFTVRKQSFGVGVERTFPLHSPKIERIEVASRGDVRRAKLYYLRGRVGRRARVRERQYTGPEPPDVIPEAFDEQGAQAEAEVLPPDEAEAVEQAEGGAEGDAPAAETAAEAPAAPEAEAPAEPQAEATDAEAEAPAEPEAAAESEPEPEPPSDDQPDEAGDETDSEAS